MLKGGVGSGAASRSVFHLLWGQKVGTAPSWSIKCKLELPLFLLIVLGFSSWPQSPVYIPSRMPLPALDLATILPPDLESVASALGFSFPYL